MELKSHTSRGVNILTINGRFDAYEAPMVADWFKSMTAASTGAETNAVVDLEGVSFIDSTGLATLVQGMKRCREEQGDLYLVGLRQPIRIIFELTRLDKAFKIYGNLQEAAQAFG